MLTEVVIQTSTPTSLKLDDVEHDEILILEGISNLTSAKVNLYMGEFATEGGYYQGRRAQSRNPVFTFRLNPNYTEDIEVSDIREMLYRMFFEPQADSDAVQVLLKDDRKPDRYFIGYTESIDTDQFTKTQKCQVSTLTTDAYLRSANLSADEHPGGWYTKPLPYEGTADTGLAMTIKVFSDTPQIVIASGDEQMVFAGESDFLEGDILTVNTQVGQKYVRLNGVDTLTLLGSNPTWLQLKDQVNTVIKTYGLVEGDGKAAMTAYSYRAAWWGI